MVQGNGGRNDLAAVDRLREASSLAVQTYNDAVANVLQESINFIDGAQRDLEQMVARMEDAQKRLRDTLDGWHGRHGKQAAPTKEAPMQNDVHTTYGLVREVVK